MTTTKPTPGSQASLREANRTRVVDTIKQFGGLTQVELAAASGLSPATVSNIVRDLTATGVLHAAPSTRSGRRARHITLAHALGVVAGVHFTRRQLRVAVSDVAQTVLVEHHLPLAEDHRADHELGRAGGLIVDALESIEADLGEVRAIGIAVPAPMDAATGLISRRGILRGWDAVVVAEVMERRLGRPVFVDNDANLAALGESRSGALRGKRNAIYIDVDHGVGAGLILGGHLYRGHSGAAGELGHMPFGESVIVGEAAAACRCGSRGCLETVVGAAAVIRAASRPDRVFTLRDVVARATAGDPDCRRVLADAGRHLGVASLGLCNLLNPERLVVGGGLAMAGELLLGPMREVVKRGLLVRPEQAPDIVQSQLGDRASVMGALAFAADRIALPADF